MPIVLAVLAGVLIGGYFGSTVAYNKGANIPMTATQGKAPEGYTPVWYK